MTQKQVEAFEIWFTWINHLVQLGIARPPPTEMLPMIKMSQKRLLFLQFKFLLAFSRTTVDVYNRN